MLLLRLFCLVALLVISVYTVIVVANHRINLFPTFFGDMMKLGWAGQFNLDFMFMLGFSALWVMWRNEFSPPGIGLGVLAFFFGAPFLSVYLLIVSFQVEGNPVRLLVGNRATVS